MSGSLRLRVTVAFSVIFLLGGMAVLAGALILVDNSMDYALGRAITDKYIAAPGIEVDKAAALDQLRADEASRLVIQRSMRFNLLAKGGATVIGVWLLGTATAWLIAGRVLRPLRSITATAQQIAGRTLHRRIGLDFPPGEVKTLADSFDSMLDRLDDAFAGQERFISNAAHELKTPIALNRTLVEVAMRKRHSPPEVHALGENLLEINLRHERLIESLLTLASAGNIITNPRPVNLAEITETTLAALMTGGGPALTCDLRPASATGDPILLEQIVRNLVENAMRYNVPGGRMEVRCRPVGWAQVELVVANTGPRIAAYEVPSLFEPFRRLTDRVGSVSGSGLGLSIVRAVAHAHHGDVHAVPRPEGGLEVCVTLPAHGSWPPAGPPKAGRPAGAPARWRHG